MNVATLREHYPALSAQTYLNTASCGILSRATAQAATQVYRDLLQQGSVPRAAWYERLAEIRRETAQWIGADAEEIALLPNFSIAHNYVAQALVAHPRVLLLDSDYSSLTMPWLLHPYELHYFSAETNGFFELDRIKKQVEEHDINVLDVSHVQYTTGFCVDLELLGQYCRERGVLLVVDATQSLGVVPINVRRMSVDILAGSGYKWMAAGLGNALLYVRRELHEQLALTAVGNNSFDDFPRVTSRDDLNFSPRLLEVGHYDFSSLLAWQQAVRELRAIGADAIRQRVKQLTDYLYERLPDKVAIVSDYPAAYRSGITVIAGDVSLERALLDRGVVTSARAQGLRISLHFYNHEADIDHLCDTLHEIL